MITSYDEAMRFLLEFIDYEKVTKYKYDLATFDLRRVDALLASVGNPQRGFKSLHVAGTKGKGSTSGIAQSILTACGLLTGLYTSPHLTRIEERMTVDGRMMAEPEFTNLVQALYPYTDRTRREQPNESPTYFELLTAAGFLHFARSGAQYASVEVGLGGRLDATNVIQPEVCCITRIDYDHVDRLGHTLDKIAWEKAGIVKPGVPIVMAPQEPEAAEKIAEVARERGAPLIRVGKDVCYSNVRTGMREDGAFCLFDLETPAGSYKDLRLRMLGEHQAINASCAIAMVENVARRHGIPLTEEVLRKGLEAAHGAARLEHFRGEPPILLDGAHNVASVRALCGALDSAFKDKPFVLLAGFSRDKDAESMLKMLLPRADRTVLTRSNSPRAADPTALAQLARECCGVDVEAVDDAFEALARARDLAGNGRLLCITGSFFLAGLLRPILLAEQPATS